MSSAIPITRKPVDAEREESIRNAVRSAKSIGANDSGSRLAKLDDAERLAAFLQDPAVHAPIYSLPSAIHQDTIAAFIEAHIEERDRGEGLLFVRTAENNRIVGYSDIQVWPKWAAGELGGALHPKLQSQGRGMAGATLSFDWMFETLNLELICATAALDNIRTERLLDGLRFDRRGLVQSARTDGSTRASRVWELSRDDWRTLERYSPKQT